MVNWIVRTRVFVGVSNTRKDASVLTRNRSINFKKIIFYTIENKLTMLAYS